MKRITIVLVQTGLAALCLAGTGAADWQKLAAPPDVNKDSPDEAISCWLITAANMLAGAGYGEGANVQARASDIFETDLKTSSEMQSYG